MSKATQVFLSHSREEDGKFAHRLAADLRGRGLKVWIAPDSIRGGESWVDAIERGLKESSHMVVILTPAATASRWVKKETEIAITMEIKEEIDVIPLELKACDVSAMLGSYQMVSFRGNYAAGLKALTKVLAVEEAARPKQKASTPFQWQLPDESLLPNLLKRPEKPKPPAKSKVPKIKAPPLNLDWQKKLGISTPGLSELWAKTVLDAPKLKIKTRSPWVHLEWSWAGLVRNYVLEKDVTGIFAKPVEVYVGDETEYTHFGFTSRISGLALGNLYGLASFYRVKAEDYMSKSSAWSNVVKVEDPKPQPAPVLKYDTSGLPSKMTWTSVIGATGYELQQSDNALFTKPVKVYEGDRTEWANVGALAIMAPMYYRVKANSLLTLFGSAWSNVVKVDWPFSIPNLRSSG